MRKMKCSKCKNELQKNVKFCPICGAKVKKRRGRRILGIFTALFLLAGAVVGGLVSGVIDLDDFPGFHSELTIRNVEEAIEHAGELGEQYGYENAMAEMSEKITTEIDGDHYYRLQQNYQGIPVYGRTAVYVTDEEHAVVSVTGNLLDTKMDGNLTPNVSKNQVLTSIKSYQKEVLGFEDSIETEIEELSEYELNIYNSDGNGRLVYSICVNGYEYLVDAQDASVYLVNCLVRTDSVTGDLQGQIQVHKDVSYEENDGVYRLEDSERKSSVYTADNQFRFWKLWNSDWHVKGKNLVVWEENGAPDVSAVDAFVYIQKAYEYFDVELGNRSIDGNGQKPIMVIDRWPNLKDNAAFSSEKEIFKIGKASISDYTQSAYLDVVAHEYMHGVEYNHSEMIYSGESGAVMEALSDIFGELVEAWDRKRAPDWIHSKELLDELEEKGANSARIHQYIRDISSPAKTGYPDIYHGDNWADTTNLNKDHGGIHTNCTVISHAAYLMWYGIDGDASKKIDTDALAKLWYRAMLTMPSDCNFAECRKLVELAASSVKLTDAQRKCVSEAFDAVGITDGENTVVDYEVAPNCKMQIYGKDGNAYGDYTITLSYNTMVGSYAKNQPLFVYQPQYNTKSKKITSSEPFSLPPDEGIYLAVVSDNADPSKQIDFLIRVDSDNTKKLLEFYTDFGKEENEGSDVYETYRDAISVMIESGTWTEHLGMTANMEISQGSTKLKTKMTMNVEANVSNYAEDDLSKVRIAGSAKMSLMGETYAWTARYEDGIAHYQYTQPQQDSVDLKMDPDFFDLGTITEDMMTKPEITDDKIRFTIAGSKITDVGIAAVNKVIDIDDLKYGDVDVTIKLDEDGKLVTMIMKFHAAMTFQGYDADVDYDIKYDYQD